MPDIDPSYRKAVDELTRAWLRARARQFINKEYNPEWPTVVVLPGGMGSEISVTDDSFESIPQPWTKPPRVRPVWIELKEIDRMIFKSDPLLLKLDENGIEQQRRLCIATGELKGKIANPYPQVAAGFAARNINYVALGFDWRKFASTAADYLNRFLDYLEDEADAAGKRSPLPVGLLAHSQGGLVAKSFVNLCAANDDAQARYSRARYRFVVTAGSPFFGTQDHLNRYYCGISSAKHRLASVEFLAMFTMRAREDEPNDSAAWMSAVRKWRSLVASMPGLYALTPSPALAEPSLRARLGLDQFPVRDEDNREVHFLADPDQLPLWLRHYYKIHRQLHEREAQALAQPLRGYARERFFCVRGVQGPRGQAIEHVELRGNPSVETEYEFTLGRVWRKLTESRAIDVHSGNAHDGVVPAWSAILDASLPVMTIHHAKHRMLVAETRVLDLVNSLANDQAWNVDAADSDGADAAEERSGESDDEVLAEARELVRGDAA